MYDYREPRWYMHQLGRRGAQPAQALAHLRLVFLQAERYGREVVVLKLDVRKAFDSVLHRDVWVSLLRQRYPTALAHVLLQLHRHRWARYVSSSGDISDATMLRRGLGQGDPTSPALFCLVLQDALSPLLAQWRQESEVNPTWFYDRAPPLLAFMDDLLVVAPSGSEAVPRYHLTHQLLARHGLILHASKTSWAASSHVQQTNLELDGCILDRHSAVTFAGVKFDFGPGPEAPSLPDGRRCHGRHVPPELLSQGRARVPVAFAVLQGYIPLLELPQAPWHLKARLIRAMAVSSMTHMQQTCQASRKMFLRLQGYEHGWLARFLGLHRRAGEGYVEFLRR